MTTYKGFYIDNRNGIRVGVHFIYNICKETRKIINEIETEVYPMIN